MLHLEYSALFFQCKKMQLQLCSHASDPDFFFFFFRSEHRFLFNSLCILLFPLRARLKTWAKQARACPVGFGKRDPSARVKPWLLPWAFPSHAKYRTTFACTFQGKKKRGRGGEKKKGGGKKKKKATSCRLSAQAQPWQKGAGPAERLILGIPP